MGKIDLNIIFRENKGLKKSLDLLVTKYFDSGTFNKIKLNISTKKFIILYCRDKGLDKYIDSIYTYYQARTKQYKEGENR